MSSLPISADPQTLEFIIAEAQASMRAAGLPIPAMFVGADGKTLVIRKPASANDIEHYEDFVAIAWQIGLFTMAQDEGEGC